MKVLFVHDGPLYVNPDGKFYGVHFDNALKQRYLNLGNEVTFLMRSQMLLSDSEAKFNKIDSDLFSFVEIPDFKSFTKYFKNIKAVKKIIKDSVNDHDIIVTRLPSAAGTIAANVALTLNKPLMTEMVGCTFDGYWNYSWKGILIAHYKLFTLRRLILKLPYVIYVTEKFLQNRYPTKRKSIACSNVYLEDVNEASLTARLGKINSYKEDKVLVIGTVASMNVRYKGQHDVINAIARLKKNGIHFHYHLVGQGDDSRLRHLVRKLHLENEVKFIGALKHTEIFSFLADIDLYIQPSKQEGLPRAVIEAMSMACPVLGSDVAGIPELLESEFIFKAGSINEIAVKLQLISREKMLQSANRNFLKSLEFKLDLLQARRISFYKEFLEEYDSILKS